MAEQLITIHLDGGRVSEVTGLTSMQNYRVLEWHKDDEIRPDELYGYVDHIIGDGVTTNEDKIRKIEDVMIRVSGG